MTDSKTIARLIYRAHVKPAPPVIDMEYDSFADALELYAKTRMRELIEEGKLELVSESDAAPPAAEEAPPEESEALKMAEVGEAAAQGLLDGLRDALQPADTHTHTIGATEGEGAAPGAFSGKGSGEKREIYAHLTGFVKSRGPGARKQIAAASNGAVTVEELFDMSAAAPYPLAKWRVVEAAMQHIEQGTES